MGVPDMGYGLLTLRRIDDEADGSKLQLQARYGILGYGIQPRVRYDIDFHDLRVKQVVYGILG